MYGAAYLPRPAVASLSPRWLVALLMAAWLSATVAVGQYLEAPTGASEPSSAESIPAADWAQIHGLMLAAQPTGDGATFANHANDISATVMPSATTVATDTGSVSVSLRSIGREQPAAVSHGARATIDAARVSFGHTAGGTAVEEWWVNTSAGLEQGFTVATRPAGAGSLQVLLAFTGALTPQIVADDNIAFMGSSLRYGGLRVWDATGRSIPARFEARGEKVAIVADDVAAHYPLTIDPTFTQSAYLKGSNTATSDEFGTSIALSGDTLVVGARNEDSAATGVNGDQSSNASGDSGAVYVFVEAGTTWRQEAYLKASNTGSNDEFGGSVAIDGDTLVVGARLEDGLASGSGAAYVFVRSGTSWSEQAYLKASNAGANDNFGDAVAIDTDTVVVGATNEDSNATGINGNGADDSAAASGAAYVFTRSGTTWSQQAYVKASNTQAGDLFGHSVGIDGNRMVIGATNEDSSASGVNGDGADNSAGDAGAAYVFARSGTVWSQEAYLKASNPDASDLFGDDVAISGDTVIAGSQTEDSAATTIGGNEADNTASEAGAAYIFVRTAGVWSQQAYLKAPNAESLDFFGRHVAIDGDVAFVGAIAEDGASTGVNGSMASNGTGTSGAAYVFRRSGATWSHDAYIKASNTDTGDFFGFGDVAVAGELLAVGTPVEGSNATGINGAQNNELAANSGAVYTYTTVAPFPQQAYLKASNTGSADAFGGSVAAHGNTVVVGAPFEDSAATGINGNQADDSGPDSGAAYVFVRTGTTWTQEAYLKASNAETVDTFGIDVAIDGDTIVVGATGEDSSATGVLGNQADNGSVGSGAAYVFVRSGASWTQQAYLKASNTSATDQFGLSVAVDANTIAVGAHNEDSNATGTGGNQADNSATNAGAVYVFFRTGTSWAQQAYVKASNTGADDAFGSAVAVDGNTLAVGAPSEDSNAVGVGGTDADNSASEAGAAYVFLRGGSSWTQQAYVKASNTDADDHFGEALALSNQTLVIGASDEDGSATGADGDQNDDGTSAAGAAYVFTKPSFVNPWAQQSYLKASNPRIGDGFGSSVAIWGDTIVVGAEVEDVTSTGINGNQRLASSGSAGAGYLFMRTGSVWTQIAYLKASNAEAGDLFGTSVAVSGDHLFLGAQSEDSIAMGVNGNQGLNSSSNSGAAYVFDILGCVVDPFTDVTLAHPFCREIKWMRDQGISVGFDDGTYRPGNDVTRQAMSAFMARLAGAELATCAIAPFSDVPTSHPFCREIQWMKDEGISTGFNDGTYRPSIDVTRQAMSAFMARLAGVANSLPACTIAPFSDVPTSHPFCKEITWMKDEGISTGFNDGTYRPAIDVTRQAMSAFMLRVSALI